MEKQELFLDTTPDSNNIWKEIGGNYENVQQSINELVDNSISNIIFSKTEKKQICITLEESNDIDGSINITIEDSGEGIENAEDALTLGKSVVYSVFNEHGFGLKQALAAANPSNDNWAIYKRSKKDRTNKQIVAIKAPYIIGKQPYEILPNTKWPGQKWSNTYISVRCDFRLFQNLSSVEESVRNTLKFSFDTVADRIYEDLGFTYSKIIQKENLIITLILKRENSVPEEHIVTPLLPRWLQNFELENEELNILCSFGQIEKSLARQPFNNRTSSKYYKTNMFSSGVEIRVNGRTMEYNKFEEIFGKKNDNHYNSLLVQVDIITDDKTKLPETRTTKNGFRVGDERLSAIYRWIRKSIKADPKTVVKPILVTEQEEKKKLQEIIEKNYFENKEIDLNSPSKISHKEVPVFTSVVKSTFPKVDLLVEKENEVTVIEAKKEIATCKDIYQLVMYCEGYFFDNGRWPDKAILIAKEFPEGVRRVIERRNKMFENMYPPFECKYWNEYQENFEECLIEEKKLKGKI